MIQSARHRDMPLGIRVAAGGLGALILAIGCLTRPIESANPVTTTRVQINAPSEAVDKIDLLFDIDNSASMGDKQAYLTAAIPDLIDRLVRPRCVDATQNVMGTSQGGHCPQGSTEEFPAIHDLHLGIVSSSLGTRLSDSAPLAAGYTGLCGSPSPVTGPTGPYPNIDRHNDDKGHLVTRSLTRTTGSASEGVVANASAGFLYWYPGSGSDAGAPHGPAPTIVSIGDPQTPGTLEGDFADLVTGVGTFGCGIESQLESWYRFLIQPDPYVSLALDRSCPSCAPDGRAVWASGVDETILKQRHDFLRPDSLVAVIVLSDENDSEIDVRSGGGQGFKFMHSDLRLPKGTPQCDVDPASPACKSVGSAGPHYADQNDWGHDVNLRHVHMKAKYGVDPQYPIDRYFLGLTSTRVPDRTGEYPPGSNIYVGDLNCVNPLFAAVLPDGTAVDGNSLCTLPVGPRATRKNLVFYAHIGGVPSSLLHFDPTDLSKSRLNDDDWVKILGKGPAHYAAGQPMSYDYSGIDPHMIEDYRDRTKVHYGFATDPSGTSPLASASSPNHADPVSGREWVTDQPYVAMNADSKPHVLSVDRQYACVFPIPPRDCTLATESDSCDCPATLGGLTHEQTPPLCDEAKQTTQIFAKAYPTVRELMLAKLMGTQGIVASICPEDVADNATHDDPRYGYRPAVAVLVDRLKKAPIGECLPQRLVAEQDGMAPCLVLVQLPPQNDGGTCKQPVCDPSLGLFGPPSLERDVLDKFCDAAEATYVGRGGVPGAADDPAMASVCGLTELTKGDVAAASEFDSDGSCAHSKNPGWCYVTGSAAKKCSQGIEFAGGSPPPGSFASMQCIETAQ